MQNVLLHRIEKEVEWRVLRNDFFPEQVVVVDKETFEAAGTAATPRLQCIPRKKFASPATIAIPASSNPTSVSREEEMIPSTLPPSLKGDEATSPVPSEKFDLVFFTTVEMFGKTVSETGCHND